MMRADKGNNYSTIIPASRSPWISYLDLQLGMSSISRYFQIEICRGEGSVMTRKVFTLGLSIRPARWHHSGELSGVTQTSSQALLALASVWQPHVASHRIPCVTEISILQTLLMPDLYKKKLAQDQGRPHCVYLLRFRSKMFRVFLKSFSATVLLAITFSICVNSQTPEVHNIHFNNM